MGDDEVKMPGGLTEEQVADLKEAVAAEQRHQQAPQLFQDTEKTVRLLRSQIVQLAGTEMQGPLAYLRSLAIQKLEECVHRIGDIMGVLAHQESESVAAVQKAQKNGTVLNFSKK